MMLNALEAPRRQLPRQCIGEPRRMPAARVVDNQNPSRPRPAHTCPSFRKSIIHPQPPVGTTHRGAGTCQEFRPYAVRKKSPVPGTAAG